MKYFISCILCCIFFSAKSTRKSSSRLDSPTKLKNEIPVSNLRESDNEAPEFYSAGSDDEMTEFYSCESEDKTPGSNIPKSKNDMPEWISRWRSPKYGLEFQPDIKTEPVKYNDRQYGLTTRDKNSIIDDTSALGKAAQKEMKDNINSYILNPKDNEPQFSIDRMDPIEYEYENKKMWLLLTEIEFGNLDSYDPNLSYYHQLPTINKGTHKITSERFHDVDNKMEKKQRVPKEKYKEADNFVYYNRRDVSWKINLDGFFVNDEKKVNMKAHFKIQPKPKEPKSVEGFRQKGTVELEFNIFHFDIEFVVTHIDDLLRPFLDDKIKCNNRVPNFNVDYLFSGIEIKKVTVQGYDEDIIEWKIPEQPQDVNPDSEPSKEEMKVKITKAEEKVRQEEIDENNRKEIVEKHLNTVINFILNNKNIVKKRLRANIMPKITWKIMKMDTKVQLSSLLYEVVKYDESFNPRSKIPDADDSIMKKVFQIAKNVAIGSIKSLFSFNNDLNLDSERHKAIEKISKAKDSAKN